MNWFPYLWSWFIHKVKFDQIFNAQCQKLQNHTGKITPDKKIHVHNNTRINGMPGKIPYKSLSSFWL